MVLEKCYTDINLEFQNVLYRASKVDEKYSQKELVFYRPKPINFYHSAEMHGNENFLSAKVLGLWLKEGLEMKSNVNCLMPIYNQRQY